MKNNGGEELKLRKIRVFNSFLFAKSVGLSPVEIERKQNIVFSGKLGNYYMEILRNGIVIFEDALLPRVKKAIERMLPVDVTHFIGSDEVGWGEKNYPLVVCAILMSKSDVIHYTLAGVMDSKMLTHDEITLFAKKLSSLS